MVVDEPSGGGFGELDQELLPSFEWPGLEDAALDDVRGLHEAGEFDRWLLSAQQRGLIAKHADGRLLITPAGQRRMPPLPVLEVGLPASGKPTSGRRATDRSHPSRLTRIRVAARQLRMSVFGVRRRGSKAAS